MTTIEKAKEFIRLNPILKGFVTDRFDEQIDVEKTLIDHSKFTLQQFIDFIEINQDKSVKGIIQELKAKL